jgi:methylamine--corrinoid protein Co-methyltransferase
MVDYWIRGENGPVCFLKEFDTKRYWGLLKSITKKYGIEHDPKWLVPTDDAELDAIWAAGLEFFLECGVLNLDTNRLILFSEEEVRQALTHIPESVTLGEGKDAVTMVYRGMEDYDSGRTPQYTWGRILGTYSDDTFEKIVASYAQEPFLDACHFQGVLPKVKGVDIKPNSPFEIMGELERITKVKSILRRYGRPGLCDGADTPISLQADLVGAEFGFKGDARNTYILPHLKTNYNHLCRALVWHSKDWNVWSLMPAYVGGQSGGCATSVVNGVAELLAAVMLYEPTWMGAWPTDALYFSNSSANALYVANFGGAAFVKNTRWPGFSGAAWQMTAGINSEEYFWETAAGAIGSACLGFGVCGGTGKQSAGLDHACGLGVRFACEVGQAVGKARLTRAQANELVLKCNAKYQPQIDTRTLHSVGGDFRTCYDLDTISPTKEYLAIYEKVKQGLRDMGLPMG